MGTPIGTTVIEGDSILKSIVEEKLCGEGRLVKVKRCFWFKCRWFKSPYHPNNTKEAY